MSQENVEVVRRLYELFHRRDVGAAFPELATPDIELRVPPLYPDIPEVFRGRAGVERWIAVIDKVWAEWRFEPERYIEAGSTVVVLTRLIAEGASSGVHLEREVAHVWSLEDRHATNFQVYLSQSEAPRSRRAAGVGRWRLGTSPAPRLLEPAPRSLCD